VQHLILLGLNHTSAPLELREKLAFDAPRRAAALAALRQRFDQCEAVILSTCNRVELYVARAPHGHPRHADLVQFLAEFHQVLAEDLSPHTYEKSERDVVKHLFTVASSLDSMVVGETQILGQVREAYGEAVQAEAAGSLLHPLFQRAVAVGKEVMTETSLAEGRLSIATIAIDYARRIFDGFSDKTILIIGAGKMGSLLLANLAALSPGKLLISNRDPAKAQKLAEKFNGDVAPFERVEEYLAAADIVVSSTGAEKPILTRKLFERVMRARRYKPVFLIDIAVPRDIAPEVGELENVYLYNLDDLQQVASATQGQRTAAIQDATKIIEEHVRQFTAWNRARLLAPFIDQLYRRSHAQAQEELARAIAKLPPVSAEERQHLEEVTRRIVNKLLHDPVQMLRQAEGLHAPMTQYMHAMEKLFRLDADEAEDSSEA
jgi:glutamyl-tRNA reductase